MKKLLLVLTFLISIVSLMAFSGGGDETNSTSGAPGAYAGDPASGGATCNNPNCHSGAPVGNLSGVITSNIPPAGYMPGSTYTVTAAFVRPGHTKFGFEISPQNSSGTQKGTMAILSGQTQLILAGKYITHTSAGVSGTGGKTWNFTWTAPPAGQGPLTFYGAFNATNANNAKTGDSIFVSTLSVSEDPTSVVQNIDADDFSLSVFPNPATDEVNVKFDLSESSSVEMELYDINGNKADDLFYGTEINGEVYKSFDLSSYPAGIYFVRLHANHSSALRRIVKM